MTELKVRALLQKGKFVSPEQIVSSMRLMGAICERAGVSAALVGGVAMQLYGSPRLTKDVDLALNDDTDDISPLEELRRISFGGKACLTPDRVRVKLIVRNDEYRELYRSAVVAAGRIMDTDGDFTVVSPEHLAAMKFATQDEGHILDLKWLLNQPDLVNVQETKKIVYKLVGGKFAVECFEGILDQVELARWKRQRSLGEYP